MSLKSNISKLSGQLHARLEEQFEREVYKIPVEDLEFFAIHGYWPEGKRYEEFSQLLRFRPRAPEFEGKTDQELEFFAVNNRWPEPEKSER
jgi:hypothetical protein